MTVDGIRASRKGVDILLIEDDTELVTRMVHALHERSLTTDVAGDAVEAKRLLARGAYAVVVVDLVLAATDAAVFDFIRTSDPASIHVVAVTGADASLLGLDRSVVEVLFFKPFNVERFASFMQTLAGVPSRVT